MTAAVTPRLALAWLASLSAGVRGTAVLDGAGARLAGDADVAERAAAALAAAPDAAEVRSGRVVAARAGDVAVAAEAGPQALEDLLVGDLRAAADLLAGR